MLGTMNAILKAAAKIFLIFVLCLQAHAADRLRLGYSSITANRLPLWLGQEAGIFARHGIDAELLLIPSGMTGVQALVAGEVQILSATGATAVAAALRGADVVIIGSLGVIEYKLAALPQIRTAEARRGRRLGISRFGSSTDFASPRVLRHIGLNPEKDVVLLQTGIAGATQRLMALFSGTMDATLTQVDTILLAQIKLGKGGLSARQPSGDRLPRHRSGYHNVAAIPQGKAGRRATLHDGDRRRRSDGAHTERSDLAHAQQAAKGTLPADSRSTVPYLRDRCLSHKTLPR